VTHRHGGAFWCWPRLGRSAQIGSYQCGGGKVAIFDLSVRPTATPMSVALGEREPSSPIDVSDEAGAGKLAVEKGQALRALASAQPSIAPGSRPQADSSDGNGSGGQFFREDDRDQSVSAYRPGRTPKRRPVGHCAIANSPQMHKAGSAGVRCHGRALTVAAYDVDPTRADCYFGSRAGTRCPWTCLRRVSVGNPARHRRHERGAGIGLRRRL